VSAGTLDGKAIVCIREMPLTYADDVLGFRFQDGNVYGNSVSASDLVYEIDVTGEMIKDKLYSEDRSEVSWWWLSYNLSDGGIRSQGWTLDRKDLTLSASVRDAMTENTGERLLSSFSCEVYNTLDTYYERLSAVRDEKQKQLEKDIKDNKI
jgi:hypothetical protein